MRVKNNLRRGEGGKGKKKRREQKRKEGIGEMSFGHKGNVGN